MLIRFRNHKQEKTTGSPQNFLTRRGATVRGHGRRPPPLLHFILRLQFSMLISETLFPYMSTLSLSLFLSLLNSLLSRNTFLCLLEIWYSAPVHSSHSWNIIFHLLYFSYIHYLPLFIQHIDFISMRSFYYFSSLWLLQLGRVVYNEPGCLVCVCGCVCVRQQN